MTSWLSFKGKPVRNQFIFLKIYSTSAKNSERGRIFNFFFASKIKIYCLAKLGGFAHLGISISNMTPFRGKHFFSCAIWYNVVGKECNIVAPRSPINGQVS